MKTLHKLLKRQIEKHLGSLGSLSEEQKRELEQFFAAIDSAYADHDRNHKLLERSLELSSNELFDANAELRSQSLEVQALYNVLSLIHQHPDIEAVCDEILKNLADTNGFPLVAIVLSGGDKNEFELVSQKGLDGVGPETCLDEAFFEARGMKTVLRIPIESDGKIHGYIWMAHMRPNAGTERIVGSARAIASQISGAFERKILNAQMKEQDAQMVMTSKLSALGEMAGGVAHEINTPLGAIMIHVGVLLERVQEQNWNSDAFLSSLNTIVKIVQRISKIIHGLRRFTRSDKNAEKAPVSAQFLVEDTLSFCLEKLKSCGVQLSVLAPPEDCLVNCVPEQICQVLLNLINNGYDAIIELPTDDKWIKIEVVCTASLVEISVTDCGLGISKDVLKKLMQPFFTTKAAGKGTGLGLSISKGIIESHQGRFFYDENSINTRFVIVLPRAHVRSHLIA